MYGKTTPVSITARPSAPSPQRSSTNANDNEPHLAVELEQKRKQIEEEISRFQEQKERELRDFEQELRAGRKRRSETSSSLVSKDKDAHARLEKPPSRTSSSSALNLLAGRGTTKQSQSNSVSRSQTERPSQKKASVTVSPSVSQPVVSLDKLNIKGETAPLPVGRPRTPPTPTLLSRTLTRSSSGSSLASSPPPWRAKRPISPPRDAKPVKIPTEEGKDRDSFAGLFTPSYLPLLDSKSSAHFESSSALVTPPAEDEAATAPSSYKSSSINEALPITASSFPPRVTISPGGHAHASKRAYTAPTVSSNRIPSALRTASDGTIVRKPKHVTFRLADSAIVEPSSSYEEGPSPQFEDEKSTKSGSGTRSPLRPGKSQLHRTLSPDEEDAEAGVKPGMGMGDVIQKLNEFTIAEAAKHGEDLVLDVDEEQDEVDDDEEDDDNLPMELSGGRHEDGQEDYSDKHLDITYHDHRDELESDEDGYFSPKSKLLSTVTSIPRGNSPLTAYRDDNWAQLSSSDKDRLLFESRHHIEDGDDLHHHHHNRTSPITPETGFSGGLQHSFDGGSGVGFFELDEELASPTARQVRPFELDNDLDDTDAVENDDTADTDATGQATGLGLSTATSDKAVMIEQSKRWSSDSASKFGIGSVPIDIVRPSLSVTSSWVGTFGH